MNREQYEAKRQARYERLLQAAQRAEQESQSTLNHARSMASVIPFGQPILIGHHSERRDRNYRERIHNKHRKGYELAQKAEYYRERAAAMQKNTAIFSDDPDAAEKIADKVARLEARQERMKAANKLVRKQDREGLLNMGFSEGDVNRLFTPDFCGRLGFPDYQITNNGANIRRLKRRAEVIERHSQDETTEETINGARIVDSVEDNRLQIFFNGKPAEEIRKELKRHGFRWTPSAGCWQAYRGNHSIYAAREITKKLQEA